MKIEKLTENKIKIIFDYKELEENNISVHSFLSNSLETQKLFLAILDIANEDCGFDISNSKISYEAFSFDNKTFIIFVTKTNDLEIQYFKDFNSKNYENISLNFREKHNSNHKIYEDNIKDLIYIFNSIEEVFSFCDYINSIFSSFNIKNSLYQYNNIFFIKIRVDKLTKEEKERMIANISEFKNNLYLSNLALIKLEEFSDLLIKNNAIQVL